MSDDFVSFSVEAGFADAMKEKARRITAPDGPLAASMRGYMRAAVETARGLALQELQEPLRPANRRSPDTRGQEHYIDSLEVEGATLASNGNLVLRITSPSPIAALLEHGSPPHEIETSGFPKGTLADPNAGTWNVRWEGGTRAASYNIWKSPARTALRKSGRPYGDAHAIKGKSITVNHPGTRAYQFIHRGLAHAFGQGTPTTTRDNGEARPSSRHSNRI